MTAGASARRLSKADARRLLVGWHYASTDIAGVFERHGGVQYDPLKPLGTNADLVLQARVPGYRVDAWQDDVYGARLAYDGWDKQASLVRMEDWPRRRIYHRWHREWWHERVFDRHPDVVEEVVAELRERGPLASTEFADPRKRPALAGSWHGTSLTKHALRALWHTGRVATHHRRNGQHVYDVAERVIPEHLLASPEPSEQEQLRFLVGVRHRAVGLLRPTASKEVWSLEVPAAERAAIVADLVDLGELVAVDVEGTRYHAHRDAWEAFAGSTHGGSSRDRAAGDGTGGDRAMRFLAPLDPLLWDRAAVAELFDFEYVWEVYKPARDRRWGYYVLPVLWGERMVGRIDARLDGGVFRLDRFWLEPGVEPSAGFAEALEDAFARFLGYLGTDQVRQNPNAHAVIRPVRDALYAAAKAVRTGGAA